MRNTEPPDRVDAIVDQWHRERPDLDAEVMGVVGRLSRVVQLGSGRVEATHRRHGLQRGEFDVLAALRRSGEPFEVTPSALADTLMLSRAGMTSRVDRLERAGFVQRVADPADRRSLRVALTPTGLALIDTVVADHIATEQQLITPLTTRERAELDHLLRKLLMSLEDPGPPATS
ncbi:MarR family winged helix-turn-helix transcriptional regulator [Nocardia coffeae]|uniref:MarR family winged helix-turn-helix transcriptional regulator n=1 Tax=Nocardia coffeae TaxID=2873381 RepID=UPI0027DECF5B|nr:MarR family transcriptional regulator [Nocardia coffeae]